MLHNEDSVDLSGTALDMLSNSREGWMQFFASKSRSGKLAELDIHNSRFNLMK